MRAVVHSGRKQHPQAVADWDEAIRLQPRAGNYYFQRGSAFADMESWSRAVADYDQAATLLPNNSTILNSRCWARALWGRQLDQALADCNAALAIDDDPNTLDSRGMVKLVAGDFAGAYEDFNAAWTRSNLLVVSLYGRGLAQIKLGREAEGRADIAAALAQDPDAAASYVTAGVTP